MLQELKLGNIADRFDVTLENPPERQPSSLREREGLQRRPCINTHWRSQRSVRRKTL